MLDEYAEDFGTNLSGQFSDEQRSQLKGSTLPYQNNFAVPDNNTQAQPQYVPNVPPVQPQQNYVPPLNYQQQPVYQPGYQPPYPGYPQYPPQYASAPQQFQAPQSTPQPGARHNRLDNIFPEESKELNELLRNEERAGCLRNVLFVVIALGIIAASFWGSFLIGKKFFMPDNNYSLAKDELPSFLIKKTKNKLKDTIDNARKLTQQTDDLFRPVDSPRDLPANAVPPEIKNKPAFINGEPLNVESAAYPPPLRTTPPVKKSVPVVKKATGPAVYKVIAGVYETKQMAADAALNLRNDGFPNFVFAEGGKYKIQIGAFKSKERALQYIEQAKEYGYNPVLAVK